MLYSKTFCVCPHARLLPLLLAAVLMLTCQPGAAQTQLNNNPLPASNLIGSDMGLPSSEADNSLIDSDSIKSLPAPPSLSPAEAAELVRNKVGGQVMSVNTLHNEQGVIYGVKVLNAGRMRIVNVDGQTGQLLNN